MITSFGRYTIIRSLGAGGMADVYLARDSRLGRQVAIKAPRVEQLSQTILARFELEAQAVANLTHPAIVTLHDYGDEDGRPYLVMRYMPGGSLADRLEKGSYPLDKALPILERIAGALDHAHAQQVIHRDVKPDNILFDNQGDAYLSDFGIARVFQDDDEATQVRLTRPGFALGTATYISPEQVRGIGEIGAASDVYSLGIVLFEMLSGRVPYDDPSSVLRAAQHVKDPIPSIRALRRELPEGVEAVVQRALAKQPRERYPTARDLVEALRRVSAAKQNAGAAGRTWIVDPLRRGDHATIGAALAAAQPGDRILVRPGIYAEGLVLRKPVEILGDGPREDIVVRSSQNVIQMATSHAVVRGLTLLQTGGNSCGVGVSQGHLVLQECDISSQGLAGVAIYNKAEATVRGNRIHDGKENGIFVYEQGQGVIENNDITGNAFSGIEINSGGNPTVRGNRIHDGKQVGIYVWEQGQGVIENNDITGNALSGIAIKSGANPTVRGNRIHDGKENGIFVYEQGQGVIENNDITGNALSGIEIKSGGNPTVRDNRIHDGKQVGIYVWEQGQGVIENNDIAGNALPGIAIKSGGNPTVRGNRIHDGQSAGIYVQEQGRGVIENNDITGNGLSGIEIKSGGNPTVRGNRIHYGQSAGIYVSEQGQGVIENNDITGNAIAGIAIKSGGNPTVRGNRIHDGRQNGIFVYEQGQGVIENNDITGNAFSGIEIKSGGNPTVRGNRIHDGKASGIYVQEQGRGVIQNNDITGNAIAGISIKSGANPTVRGNRIHCNKNRGIWVYEQGAGTFEGNDLRDNDAGAWGLDDSSRPLVKRSGNSE